MSQNSINYKNNTNKSNCFFQLQNNTKMSSFLASSVQVGLSKTSSDYLARTIKLSYCYLSFYIIQIVFAITLCSMLFFDKLELVPYVQIPVVFFILLDMVLSAYVRYEKCCLSHIQVTNMVVLVGSLLAVVLDLLIPDVTQDKKNIVTSGIILLRYGMQSIWITKLFLDSKKIIQTSKQEIIILEHNNQVQQQLNNCVL